MKKQHVFKLVSLVILLSMLLTACFPEATASEAACVLIVGNGVYDREVKKIVYPGQSIPDSTDYDYSEKYYVPCNNRNYYVTDGSRVNANQEVMGDTFTLLDAWTNTGTPILIAATIYWRLNQDPVAMENFWGTCLKYSCASSEDVSGTTNYSTPGWNGMLGETMYWGLYRSIRANASSFGDELWDLSENTTSLRDNLALEVSEDFKGYALATLGYETPIFCAQSSQWVDPANPGAEGNSYDCLDVTITIDEVLLDTNTDNSTQAATAINTLRRRNAEELYGEYTPLILGYIDAIKACGETGATCSNVFNIGDLPTSVPLPLPEPAEPLPIEVITTETP